MLYHFKKKKKVAKNIFYLLALYDFFTLPFISSINLFKWNLYCSSILVNLKYKKSVIFLFWIEYRLKIKNRTIAHPCNLIELRYFPWEFENPITTTSLNETILEAQEQSCNNFETPFG